MLYLSVSAIKDYLLCPKIYWYRVHRKDAFVPTDYITRGNIVHKAIEKSFNLEGARKIVSDFYSDSNYVNSKASSEIDTMLTNYYTMIEPNLTSRPKSVIEQMFKIPWSNNVVLVGKMDRADTLGNIYDWKTATKTPSVYELQDIQFYIYWWAYQQIYKKKPTVYYGHLYSGKLLPIDIHEDMWYNIKALVDEIANKLTDDNTDYPRLFGYKCNTCFYKGVCWSDYELGN